jgi:hypothetical protein
MSRIKHFALAIAVLLSIGGSTFSFAVPVKPNLEKILKQQERRNRSFEPAQAGWNGPETQRAQDVSPNAVLETYGPAATERAVRASLMAAAIPDAKALLAIGLLIILMRTLRQVQERERRLANVVLIRPAIQTRGERKAA